MCSVNTPLIVGNNAELSGPDGRGKARTGQDRKGPERYGFARQGYVIILIYYMAWTGEEGRSRVGR